MFSPSRMMVGERLQFEEFKTETELQEWIQELERDYNLRNLTYPNSNPEPDFYFKNEINLD